MEAVTRDRVIAEAVANEMTRAQAVDFAEASFLSGRRTVNPERFTEAEEFLARGGTQLQLDSQEAIVRFGDSALEVPDRTTELAAISRLCRQNTASSGVCTALVDARTALRISEFEAGLSPQALREWTETVDLVGGENSRELVRLVADTNASDPSLAQRVAANAAADPATARAALGSGLGPEILGAARYSEFVAVGKSDRLQELIRGISGEGLTIAEQKVVAQRVFASERAAGLLEIAGAARSSKDADVVGGRIIARVVHEWCPAHGDEVFDALVLGTKAQGDVIRKELLDKGTPLIAGGLEDFAKQGANPALDLIDTQKMSNIMENQVASCAGC